jgi:hypothetical protein
VTVTLNVNKKPRTITWNPAERTVKAGDALGGTLLSATAPDGVPTYHIAGRSDAVTAQTKLPASTYTIVARLPGDATYLDAAEVSVEVKVERQPQTVSWQPPRTEIAAGTALGDVLNVRVTPSNAAPVYQIVGGQGQTVTAETVLAFGAYRIAASAPQTDLFLAAQPVEASITVARQPQTITWRPAKTELAAGAALGDVLNGSVSPGNGTVTYQIENGAAVTAESVLRPAVYRIIATAAETPLLLAPEPVRHEIKILPPAENRQ